MRRLLLTIVSIFLIINILLLSSEGTIRVSTFTENDNLPSINESSLESHESNDNKEKEQIPTYQVYKANMIINGINGYTIPVYDIVNNPDRKLTYAVLAECAMEDTGLYYSSGLWTTYFDDVFKNHPQYAYEAMIMSYLDYDAETSQLEDTMSENVKSFGIDILLNVLGSAVNDKITDKIDENANALKIKNQILALPEEEARKALSETINLQIGKGVLDSLNNYEDTSDLITNVSILGAADQKRTGQITFLKKVAEGINDNEPLKAAINDIAYSYENQDYNSFKSQTGKEKVYNIGKATVSWGWEQALNKIEKSDPEIALVLESIKLGGSGLNALFGTTTRSQELMSILSLYVLDAELKRSLSLLKDTFINNPNQDNAIAFNYAFDSYLDFQKYADSVAKQYVNDIINGGLLTKKFAEIFHRDNIQNADDLMSLCDSEIATRKAITEQTKKYFSLYCGYYKLSAYAEAFDTIETDSDSTNQAISDNSTIEIPDPILKTTIQETLGIGNREITRKDALLLTSLEYNEGWDYEEYQIKDISGLSEFKNITTLNLSGNALCDLNELSGLTKLRTLELESNDINDISGLSNLRNLKILNLSGNRINDISSLSGLKELTTLNLSDNELSNLSGLHELTYLTTLDLGGNEIADLNEMYGLTNLTELSLVSNKLLSDIKPISGLINLTAINLCDNQISDISALSRLTKLENLYLSYNEIDDISALSYLTNLKSLWLGHNQIVDVTALSDLTKLLDLELCDNQISAIDGLSKLIKLTKLDLSSNQISDISSLSKMIDMKYLYLSNNMISDTDCLSNLTKLESLDINGNPVDG